MVDKFLEYIQIEKRYSENTILSYRKDLEDFKFFYLKTEASEEIEKANKKSVRNFIIQLSEDGISKRSINRKLSSLRSFYRYLLKIQEIEVSPLETISALKFYPEKQIPFSKDEMNFLLDEILSKNENILHLVIIETLYQTGIRRFELCNLLLQNVDFNKNEILVIGKGNKQRIIPFSENLKKKFKGYLQARKPLETFSQYFFVQENGKKLSEKFVYSIVNKYLGLVSSKEKKSPHVLRHSFATHVLENGAEISKVKSIMGHASLASTQVYTSANIEQLKKVFNKAHPRAKKQDE